MLFLLTVATFSTAVHIVAMPHYRIGGEAWQAKSHLILACKCLQCNGLQGKAKIEAFLILPCAIIRL